MYIYSHTVEVETHEAALLRVQLQLGFVRQAKPLVPEPVPVLEVRI